MNCEYFPEPSLEQSEPTAFDKCSYCKDAICVGEKYYDSGATRIHAECFQNYLNDDYSDDELARALGFAPVFAERTSERDDDCE